jgi:hypothetical protein
VRQGRLHIREERNRYRSLLLAFSGSVGTGPGTGIGVGVGLAGVMHRIKRPRVTEIQKEDLREQCYDYEIYICGQDKHA